MKKLIFPIIFLMSFQLQLSFGSEKDSTNVTNAILYEKVYLHVDRELYAPGDDIWFKSYLVSGINNRLIPGYKNIYVQLISDSGQIVLNRLLLSNNGTAKGEIQIPLNLTEGNYKIRAYTKYLTNFGNDSYFYKNIVISDAKNSLEIGAESDKPEPSEIDVSFLPEGGSFVLNAINYVAFKAIDKSGKGVHVKGKIVDEQGNEVVSFQTSYKGMGKFIMMPQEGKNYFALVENYPNFNYQFEPAKPDGICLNYKPDGNYLQFTLTRNLKINYTQDLVLKASHKGIELFNSEISMDEFQHAQRLFKGLFPQGISKVTILDKQNNKLAERMIFVRNANEKTIQLTLNKEEYQAREKVEIDISALLPQSDTITSTLSVAVVHEDYFSSTGNTQSIESFLLLDSELKGSIESPASCFLNENNITAEEKLDLVMLINGWRNYYWNDLKDKVRLKLPGWADIGLTLRGDVKSLWGDKPVDAGKVVLGPFSRNFLFEETTTDYLGNYSFDRLYLKDSALIMINSETRRGLRRTVPSLKPQILYDSIIQLNVIKNICPEIDIPMKFYRDNYFRRLAEREFEIESGSILLGDVDITAEKLVRGDGHYRLYGEPDVSLQITDDDIHYMDILDYLQGRVAGVLVQGGSVNIRNSSRSPLLVVDGLETGWDQIQSIAMGDIDKIEILKSGFTQAVYGSRGGDGVISVLTKMGKGDWEYEFKRIVRGRITPRVQGFQQAREFYSPKYTVENINDTKPDYRPTLYWNPEVKFENGLSKIEFFASDHLARFTVVIEGISKNGKICYATSLLTVSIPQN